MAHFNFERDWKAERPLAIQAWDVVCDRFRSGARAIDLLREADTSRRESTGLPKLFYHAIWHRLMTFVGDILDDLDELDHDSEGEEDHTRGEEAEQEEQSQNSEEQQQQNDEHIEHQTDQSNQEKPME